MPPEIVLHELLSRIGAQSGSRVYINEAELSKWPAEEVKVIKSTGLITKATPATSAICSGCERQCSMPVHTQTNNSNILCFIVCDKRSDINRVFVPIKQLEQWQTSADAVAALVAKLLDINHTKSGNSNSSQREIGLFKGDKLSSHVALLVDSKLSLSIAGHVVELTEVLSVQKNSVKIDRRRLVKLVDNPAAGGGGKESADERQQRLQRRVNGLKMNGIRSFLKQTAEEEGITLARLQQILKR